MRQGNKITIVGAGNVGTTTAYTLLLSGLVNDLVLIDLNKEKAAGEVMDLSHGIPLCPPADIHTGDYPDCKDSDIVIITAGANQKPGETRIDLMKRNIAVFQSIIPQVIRYAPEAILLIVTNPVDILTHIALKISGLPAHRVIGSGTVLDTSRLKYRLSQHTGIDARNIHTYILGEHGDTELAAWSLTSIAGMGLEAYCAACGKCHRHLTEYAQDEVFEEVRTAAYHIIERKGATFYAVAVAVRRIVEAILRDEKSILTISTLLDGEYGLKDVCLSLPAIVGANGCERVLPVELSTEETQKFVHSGQTLKAFLDQLL